MSNRSHTLIGNVSWLAIGYILTNLISIVITIFIIRKLPVDDFGIYSMFMGSLVFFAIFSINPVLLSIKRFIPEFTQKQYYKYLKSLLIWLISLSLTLGFVCIMIVYFIRFEIGDLLNIPQFDVYYSLFIINIIVFFLISLNDSILISFHEQKTITILNIVSILVRGGLYSTFFSIINLNYIFIFEAISQGIKVVISSYLIIRKISAMGDDQDFQIKANEKKTIFKRIRRYTTLSLANEMGAGALSEYSDYYFISGFLGPVALGFYAFPNKLIHSVLNWFPIVKFSEVVKPFFIKHYYANNESNLYLARLFKFYFKVFFILYAFIAALIISYQELIHIYVFESKYLDTQLLLAIILFFYAFRSMSYPAGMIFDIKERVEYQLYSKIFAIFNILLVFVLLSYSDFGIYGVAIATGLSISLKNGYMYFIIRSKFGFSIPTGEMLRVVTVILIPTAISIYLGYNIDNLISRLFLPISFGVILFIIIWRYIKPFDKLEREILNKIISHLPARLNYLSRVFALNN